jgi:hypothetical protein
MARRRRTAAGMDSLEDLARKSAILEQELAVQREALDKLRKLGRTRKPAEDSAATAPTVRKTA